MSERKIVETLSDLEQALEQVKKAQQKFATFSQQQVDNIFKAVALTANNMRIPLARLAVEETGMGVCPSGG